MVWICDNPCWNHTNDYQTVLNQYHFTYWVPTITLCWHYCWISTHSSEWWLLFCTSRPPLVIKKSLYHGSFHWHNKCHYKHLKFVWSWWSLEIGTPSGSRNTTSRPTTFANNVVNMGIAYVILQLILNANLVKSRLPTNYFSITQSFWKCDTVMLCVKRLNSWNKWLRRKKCREIWIQDEFLKDILYCTHYSDVIMSAMASQLIGVSIVCSTVCSGAYQRKHQSSASLVFWGESTGHRWILLTKGQ